MTIRAREDDGSEWVNAEAFDQLLAVLKGALSLAGGWREAIVELEDFCSEPVRLKNMIAAADQIDLFTDCARAAIAKAEGREPGEAE